MFRAGFGEDARVADPDSVVLFRDHLTFLERVMPEKHRALGLVEQSRELVSVQRAFAEAAADEFPGTDEASLLERAGVQVAVVAGSARNFKITQPGDIELAEFYLGQATADLRG